MVNCDKQVRLDAYHDGELSPTEWSDVESHLRDCPSCAAELAAIRRMSGTFADTTPCKPSHEQLLQLAASVRVESSDARMLLRLFRATAIAAAVLIAFALVGALYLSQRTKAAAHETMVLDHVPTWSRTAGFVTDPLSDARQSAKQGRLAQWIADDLQGRQEER
jgi:anti-sigma factor RsiW